jgi:hypothetical protein
MCAFAPCAFWHHEIATGGSGRQELESIRGTIAPRCELGSSASFRSRAKRFALTLASVLSVVELCFQFITRRLMPFPHGAGRSLLKGRVSTDEIEPACCPALLTPPVKHQVYDQLFQSAVLSLQSISFILNLIL